MLLSHADAVGVSRAWLPLSTASMRVSPRYRSNLTIPDGYLSILSTSGLSALQLSVCRSAAPEPV
jgi:hypothetical protein